VNSCYLTLSRSFGAAGKIGGLCRGPRDQKIKGLLLDHLPAEGIESAGNLRQIFWKQNGGKRLAQLNHAVDDDFEDLTARSGTTSRSTVDHGERSRLNRLNSCCTLARLHKDGESHEEAISCKGAFGCSHQTRAGILGQSLKEERRVRVSNRLVFGRRHQDYGRKD